MPKVTEMTMTGILNTMEKYEKCAEDIRLLSTKGTRYF